MTTQNGLGESNMIKGVEIIYHEMFADPRGFFHEVLNTKDKCFTQFGQLSHTYMRAGVAKAWHYHKLQEDFWYVVSGTIKAVLWDIREDSPTHNKVEEYYLSTSGQVSSVLVIPTMVAHGLTALENTHMVYVTSKPYNPNDEHRLPADSVPPGYDWWMDFDIK